MGIDGSSQTGPLQELPCLKGGAKDKVGLLLGPNHLCGHETEKQGSKDLTFTSRPPTLTSALLWDGEGLVVFICLLVYFVVLRIESTC